MLYHDVHALVKEHGILDDQCGTICHRKHHSISLTTWSQAWVTRYLLDKIENQRPLMFICLFTWLIT